MLHIFPEKRASAASVLQSKWLTKMSNNHICGTDEEVEANVKSFIESKSAYLYFRQLKNYASDQYFGDIGEEDCDTDEEDDHLGFRNFSIGKFLNKKIEKNRPKVAQHRERSFTNQYVGYDEGIDVDELDSTANWQFNRKLLFKKHNHPKVLPKVAPLC